MSWPNTRKAKPIKLKEAAVRIRAGLKRRTSTLFPITTFGNDKWGGIEIGKDGLTKEECRELSALLGVKIGPKGLLIPPHETYFVEYVRRAEEIPTHVVWEKS